VLVSILVAFALPTGGALAAPGDDTLCRVCFSAVDPVRYTASDARADAETESGNSLKGPEYWLTRSGSRTYEVAEDTVDVVSPAVGPEYYAGRLALRAAEEAEYAMSAVSPAVGPEYYAGRLALRAVGDKALSGSPSAGPEFWARRMGRSSGALAQGANDGRSSMVGPEFWIAHSVSDLSKCLVWSEALDRFHLAKRVEDPANGALSLAQAAFYVAEYGADGAAIVSLDNGGDKVLCET
jgi:hypothetical protein